MKNENEIRDAVRERYSKIASSSVAQDCCTGNAKSVCCSQEDIDLQSLKIGYSIDELSVIPENANLGLGCGNPNAIANLKKGETVVDLGSGAGIDVFLAAQKVGGQGKVIGVDMTPDMISKARKNAEKVNLSNVEFRLGEIEHLPVANESVDVIISNCVINLSPEKQKVLNEAYRILKHGGRLAFSDIINLKELPKELKEDLNLYGACISGASSAQSLELMLGNAGFKNIRITPKMIHDENSSGSLFENEFDEYVISANIEAVK